MANFYQLYKELVEELDKHVSMYSTEGEILYRACRVLNEYEKDGIEVNYKEIAEDCIDLIRGILDDIEEDAHAIFNWVDDIRSRIEEFDSLLKPELRKGSEDNFTRFYYGQRTYAFFVLNKCWYEVKDKGFLKVSSSMQRELQDAHKEFQRSSEGQDEL